MRKRVIEMRGMGDSLGGVVECVALNLPVGLGEPVFGSLDSDLARIALSIPAVKGVDFGSGFASVGMTGTQNNDLYRMRDGKITSDTNRAGGILGGLSNGMPLSYRVAFKPASSMAAKQRTVDMSKGEEVDLVVPGRHDPTVVPAGGPGRRERDCARAGRPRYAGWLYPAGTEACGLRRWTPNWSSTS